MKILNLGSLNNDNVYSLDHIVTPGETIFSTKIELFCGGKGLNQSIALAKAGADVYHAGMIGEDGDNLLEACKKHGVKSEYIRKIEGKSGHTIIQVDKNGQNSIILYGGSNRSITKEYIDEVLENFEKGSMLLVQNEVNNIDYAIEKAYEKGLIIAINPSPYDSNLDACDFNKVSLFLLNEIEGYQVTGKKEPEEILKEFKVKYPNAMVVLTLGSDGAIYQDRDKLIKQPIFPAKVVDTTAAGDTFTGYFIASIMSGKSEEYALELASKASSIAVSRNGAVSSIPLLSEVKL